MKRIVLTIAVLINCIVCFAQDNEKESPFSVNCDFWSRYVWRGTDYGASPNIQPYMSVNKAGFSVGFWGAYATNRSGVQEADFYLSYTFHKEMFTILITDYYFPNENVGLENYFEYDKNMTGHIYEVTASFNGTEKIPLTFLLASNVYGADARKYDANGNPTEKIMYSTYAELGYSFDNAKAFAGFSFMDPDESRNEVGFYGNSIGFVNIGCSVSKDIQINDNYSVPLTVSFITNPMSEKVFLVAGITF